MRVLITGGTGSLGHALVSTWQQQQGLDLVVLSRDEYKQSQMAQVYPQVRFFLGDVRDVERLKLAFHGVDAVVHAAALKRVDAVAGDPMEVFKTNVLGTWNVLHAALYCRVPRVLLVSTDKACEPINAYGASKFTAEQLVVAFNAFGVPQGTRASVVRYGNVVGSRGSVVTVWREQEPPLQLTEAGMTRFLITLPEAVDLVGTVLNDMEGGEIVVPKLAACTLEVLAEAVRPGVPVQYLGKRPGGEKSHETLMTEEEATRAVDCGDVYEIRPHTNSWRPGWPLGEVPKQGLRSDTAPQLTAEDVRAKL